jgi:hypothetical protein
MPKLNLKQSPEKSTPETFASKAYMRNVGKGEVEYTPNAIRFYLEKGRFSKEKTLAKEVPLADVQETVLEDKELAVTANEVTYRYVIDNRQVAQALHEKLVEFLKTGKQPAAEEPATPAPVPAEAPVGEPPVPFAPPVEAEPPPDEENILQPAEEQVSPPAEVPAEPTPEAPAMEQPPAEPSTQPSDASVVSEELPAQEPSESPITEQVPEQAASQEAQALPEEPPEPPPQETPPAPAEQPALTAAAAAEAVPEQQTPAA